jgi:hypothetical protein
MNTWIEDDYFVEKEENLGVVWSCGSGYTSHHFEILSAAATVTSQENFTPTAKRDIYISWNYFPRPMYDILDEPLSARYDWLP